MLQVTCAIIVHRNKVLICQRSETMKLPLKWEFPGGKIETGESKEDCLRREMREELGIEVYIGSALTPVEHQYPTFTLHLYPFICTVTSTLLQPTEHVQAIWVSASELSDYDWADADIPIVNEYLSLQKK
ncbi:(deoxy)nucleoside triphosphate pyrophosphohydrolase [Sphingobacterium yanglingense]|uniref:8-oxo-dGTP diphosphatase n=1 Tax=Sphingobacterium yanglingense TaxID=1437280 RepID=A0A4R6WIV7_9SPHI|nr:(deoxy)nucleoside triphosphate pyrophosphohydrolase [Sphingobacterium yanglingense]TDQ80220.1 8-oxo-dGTP diphosphatase [Sphingobacterium yanglingense]